MTKVKTGKFNKVLEPFLTPITELSLDPANERKHGERDLEGIKGSLTAFGQQTPIVFEPQTKQILKGNGTYMAARELGWTHIIAIPTDLQTKVEQAGYRVADNRTSELSEWDMPALAETLKGLHSDGFDTSFMFNEADIQFYTEGWDSNHDNVEKTDGHTGGLIDVIKIVCPEGMKTKVKQAIAPVLDNFKGIHVD